MTDITIDSVLLRGAGARRLTAVAAHALPAALDNALSDLDDVEVPRIEVTLDADVAGLDDHTIAALWASAIRAEVVAAGATPRDRRERAATADPDRESTGRAVASRHEARALAARWLQAGDAGAPIPREALDLARDPARGRAGSADAALDADLVRQLTAALRLHQASRGDTAVISPDTTASGVTEPDPADHTEAQANGPDSDATKRGAWKPPPAARPAPPRSRDPRPVAPLAQADAAALDAIADLLDPSALSLDPLMLTRAGGLPLVFPWLADLGRAAQALHPDRDPVALRVRAFAAVVDPDNLELLDDPLVGFLAGAHAERAPVLPAPLAHDADLVAEADAVLRRFAGLLPGFAESSTEFIRAGWIARLGVLDAELNPARLTAASHPLDVVLARLPYPVSLIKLPWAPPLTVRFRP